MGRLQDALTLLYPNQCALCGTLTDRPGGLCPSCWRDTPMIGQPACPSCGAPLMGADHQSEECDACIATPRPWSQGRAALRYADKARHLVMSLKHGDRPDLAPVLASWMHAAGRDILTPGTVLVPVPLHWTRLFTRQYNQSAELVSALTRLSGCSACLDGLIRHRRTASQGNRAPDARRTNVAGAISLNPRRLDQLLAARNICIVDDVMTSGATLAAATQALHDHGQCDVNILVLARASKAI